MTPGLIGPTTQPAPAADTMQPPPAAGPPATIQASQADPKADKNQYVAKALAMIHDPAVCNNIIGMLAGSNPVQQVAAATVMVMERIDAASRSAGTEVQDTVKMYAVNDIIKAVADLGEAAGKFRLNSDLLLLTLTVCVQNYVKAEVKAGRIDPQKLQAKVQSDMKLLPQKDQIEARNSQMKIAQIARVYNNGKGMNAFQSQPKPQKKG